MASKRDVVLAAARAAFAAHGYDRATYRGIASAAGVDPSLVVQFYGAKPDLFAAATALPEGSGAMLAERLAGDPARAGERVAAMVVAWLAEPATRDALVARVRAAAAGGAEAERLRAFLAAELGPFARSGEAGELRTAVLAAELAGLVYTREVLGDPALAALGPRELVALLAPAFQRALTASLSGSAGR